MKKGCIIFGLIAAVVLAVSALPVEASAPEVQVELSMGESQIAPVLPEGLVGAQGKGQPLSDACRTQGSTLVISAKVRVVWAGNTNNLAVSIDFTDDSGGNITYTPNPLTFDIPYDQTENTGDFTISLTNANMAVYTINANATITDINTGTVLYNGGDSEPATIIQVVINSAPTTILPGGSNVINYTVAFPPASPCSLTSGLFEVFDNQNNLLYTEPISYAAGTYNINWDGRDNNGQDINETTFYMDLFVEKGDGRNETGDTTDSSITSVWKLKYRIPDDLSGVNLGTVTPALVTTNVVISSAITDSYAISDYNVVKEDTNALVTLKRGADPADFFLFYSSSGSKQVRYQVTVTSSVGSAKDLAGNEWDMDPGTGGIQRTVVWKFKLDSNGNFLKWNNTPGYEEVIN